VYLILSTRFQHKRCLCAERTAIRNNLLNIVTWATCRRLALLSLIAAIGSGGDRIHRRSRDLALAS
jgi:hypothetical protein